MQPLCYNGEMDRDPYLRRFRDNPVKRAGAFGVDPTVLARNLALTPDERLCKLDRSRRTLRLLREMRERGRFVD